MLYVRVYLGATVEDPGITLYEVDAGGQVHRQVEILVEGARFAPEEILMLGTVDARGMVQHPAAEEIDAEAFESLWEEVVETRPFLARVPDTNMPWEGTMEVGGHQACVRWDPAGSTDAGWSRVPGFRNLFALGDEAAANDVYRGVFLETPIAWDVLTQQVA